MQEDIKKALEVLKSGGIILYPTDTIWGIGCDATNPEAVKRIYDLKKRADSKSMLVLMENPALLDRYVSEVPEVAWDLVEISTTPLTVIYPRAKKPGRQPTCRRWQHRDPFHQRSFYQPLAATFSPSAGFHFGQCQRRKNHLLFLMRFPMK